jgi:hypothetical protein
VDAGSFAVAAALVFMIGGNFKPSRESADTDETAKTSFWGELKEGVAWLWGHDLFRPMAIALGVINALFMVAFSTYVLFVQEVLKLDATTFGLLLTAAAAGGVLGSLVAPRAASSDSGRNPGTGELGLSVNWLGMMPIGSLLGGVIVLAAEPALGREMALRAPFFFAAAANLGLYLYALPRLNPSRIEKAKQEGGYQETAESSDASSESTEV